MNSRLKISLAIYALLVLSLLVTAVLYIAVPTVMPYHLQALGAPWGDIIPGAQVLLWVLVKVVGVCFTIITLAISCTLYFPFRKGERWAIVLAALLSVCTGSMALWASLYVHLKTGAATPWPFGMATVVLAVVAAGISLGAAGTGRA